MENEMKNKAMGIADQSVGKSKVAVGKLLNDNELKAKGTAQNLEGSAEAFMGNAKSAFKKAAEVIEQKAEQLRDKAKHLVKE